MQIGIVQLVVGKQIKPICIVFPDIRKTQMAVEGKTGPYRIAGFFVCPVDVGKEAALFNLDFGKHPVVQGIDGRCCN